MSKKEFEIFWESLGIVNYYSFDSVWVWIDSKLKQVRIDENEKLLSKMDADTYVHHFPTKAIADRIKELEK